VVAIWDFPAMKAGLLNASMGHICIQAMPAVSRDEWKSLIRETWGKKDEKR